ncbi:MAG: hypothetical protein H0W58_10250 [Acidobacteria bacterium]|jgi:hypothetical protein|nr:hypothetical protein [Acidobacteriota bacterium]
MSRKNLTINNLIQYATDKDDEIIVLRLLYADNINDISFVIDIHTDKGLPEFRRHSRLAEDIKHKIASIASDDPWARIISENELPKKIRKSGTGLGRLSKIWQSRKMSQIFTTKKCAESWFKKLLGNTILLRQLCISIGENFCNAEKLLMPCCPIIEIPVAREKSAS